MQNMVRIFYLLFLLLEFSTVGFSQKVQFAMKNYGKNERMVIKFFIEKVNNFQIYFSLAIRF
jgi:hypothetical protein